MTRIGECELAQYNKDSYCTQLPSWSIFAALNDSTAVMIPSESPSHSQTTEAATQPNNDGFLYQCRVSLKISTRVGGNRNGKSNGFHRAVAAWSFPGNECLVDNIDYRRVPVLKPRALRRESKASTNLTRRIP